MEIDKASQISRTLGDGEENPTLSYTNNDFSKLLLKITKPNPEVLKSMKPVQPTSKIMHLVPKYVPREKKLGSTIFSRPKEPKFIPYEPYKGAVVPIKAQKKKKKIVLSTQTSRNNIEIQELVEQLSEIRSIELNEAKLNAIEENKIIPIKQWSKEKETYETDIKNLKETISHLENQLKFQSQVNSELKTLLVAAVGEDLETRVQHLTEDKLSLARELLSSAHHLTSHQEQTEWLSGQCEVWRSKFLASSLMVEELARWKSSLTKRTNDVQEVLKKMLNEHLKIQKEMIQTFANLASISQKVGGYTENKQNLKSKDILELSSKNLEISNKIVHALNIKNEDINIAEIENLNSHTPLEKVALKKESKTDVQLHLAALNGNVPALVKILDSGKVHVDSQDKEGTTPLILAAANGHFECVKELIDQGADPALKRVTGTTALFFAAQGGFLDIVKFLLKHGANVNITSLDGGSPLFVACQGGHIDVVKELVQRGSKVNSCMKDKATPLFIAAQNGHYKVLLFLLAHGAQPNARRIDGTTPLWIAAQMGHDHIAAQLLKAGAFVDAARNDGATPLFKASHKGYSAVVSELLRFKPALGILSNGETPLHAAAFSGSLSVCKQLVGAGSNPNLKNQENLTPAQVAKNLKHYDVCDYLNQCSQRASTR